MKNGSLLLLFLASASGLLAGTGTDTEKSKPVPAGMVSVANHTYERFKCVIAGDSMSGDWQTIPGITNEDYSYRVRVPSKLFTWGSGATKGIVNPQLACGLPVAFSSPEVILTVPYEDLTGNLADLEIHEGLKSPYVIYSRTKNSIVAVMTKPKK